MAISIIVLVALVASLLTFFSGFGLGTILTPVFILFFPVEVAIALTGIVHFLNNFFKLILVYKDVNWRVAINFGITSIIGAFIGAELLLIMVNNTPLYTYVIHEKQFSITTIKLIMAILMIGFALLEAIPSFKNFQFSNKNLLAGGAVSGFFGGLSGNQGALRSMFLIRSGLSKEGFVATGILIGCAVDVTRLSVYFTRLSAIHIHDNVTIILAAVLSSFAGAFIGSKLLKKVTLLFVQRMVVVMIVLLALGLGTGLL